MQWARASPTIAFSAPRLAARFGRSQRPLQLVPCAALGRNGRHISTAASPATMTMARVGRLGHGCEVGVVRTPWTSPGSG